MNAATYELDYVIWLQKDRCTMRSPSLTELRAPSLDRAGHLLAVLRRRQLEAAKLGRYRESSRYARRAARVRQIQSHLTQDADEKLLV